MTRPRFTCRLSLVGLLALLLALLPVAPAAAQEPGIEWIRQFGTGGGDVAIGIAVDVAGNIYVAGRTDGTLPGQTSAGDHDAFVRQYHANGTEGWTHQFGTGAWDYALGVAVSAAGDVYVAGWTAGSLPGQTNAGVQDAFVRQYHADGSEGWTRQFGTAADDWATGVAVDGAGDVYLLGWTTAALAGQTSAGGRDAFVRRYTPDGAERWTHQFGTGADEWPDGIAVGVNGDVYVAGSTDGTFPGQVSTGEYDVFVVELNGADGSEGWLSQFGTPAGDQAAGIALDATDNVYVAGYTRGTLPGQASAGDDDAFVRQYRPGGTEGWTHQFGTAAGDVLSGVAVDVAGNVYLAGTTFGAFPGQTSTAYGDVFVRRYHPDGSEGWTYQVGTAGEDWTPKVAVDVGWNVYLAGLTTGTFPGQVSSGNGDAFVVKLHPATTPATPIPTFPSTRDHSYFPLTGHSLAYGFQAFWERNGALPVFGYPLTEEFSENGLTVQYTERQRFEWHPELRGTPYEVELGLLGVTDAQRQGLLGAPPFQPLPAGTQSDANCRFFPQTGHRLCLGFKAYWQSHGLDFGNPGVSYRESLALFGYPISEEFVDPTTGLVTQYFERAVFEYHPENAGTPHTVLLRRLGADELQARGWLP